MKKEAWKENEKFEKKKGWEEENTGGRLLSLHCVNI